MDSFSDASNFDIMVINSAEREPSSFLGDQFYTVYVSDTFNNPPSPGSTISFEGSGECEALTEVPPIPDTNKAGAYATALAVQTNDFAQSLEEAANSAPDQLTVKLTLPNGSFITETYACRVDRCADDPAQFPDFSPSPPSMRPVSKTGPTYRNIFPLQRLGGALAVCRDDSGSMMM